MSDARGDGNGGGGESEPSGSSVFPIAFFRFSHTLELAQARQARERGWKETGWLRSSLKQPRCTGMLIAKLVAPENRMEAMEDDHAEPNIDLEYLGASGHDISRAGVASTGIADHVHVELIFVLHLK